MLVLMMWSHPKARQGWDGLPDCITVDGRMQFFRDVRYKISILSWLFAEGASGPHHRGLSRAQLGVRKSENRKLPPWKIQYFCNLISEVRLTIPSLFKASY